MELLTLQTITQRLTLQTNTRGTSELLTLQTTTRVTMELHHHYTIGLKLSVLSEKTPAQSLMPVSSNDWEYVEFIFDSGATTIVIPTPFFVLRPDLRIFLRIHFTAIQTDL